MKKIIVILFCLYASFSSAEEALTLNDFLSDVLKTNPLLRASEQRIQSAQNRIKPAAALDDPFLALGVDEVPFGERNFDTKRYQFSQNIPFPGKRQTKEKIAEAQANMAETDAETLRREIVVFATQAYYKTLYNNQAIALNSELIDLVEALLGSARARYQTGGSEHHEWLLSKIERTSLDIERRNLLRQQATLYRGLSELTGVQADYSQKSLLANFTPNPTVQGSSSFTEQPLSDQPEMNSLTSQLQRAEQQSKLAKLGYYPDFVVQAMAMTTVDEMDEDMSEWGLMIGVTLPLYAAAKQSQLASAARYEQHALELEKQNLLNRLNNEKLDAEQQLLSAKDIVELYEKSVIPQTEMAVANVKASYAAKKLNLSQYLTVLKIQRAQKLELLAAKIDVELALLRSRELLSAPPLLRLAPARPSLFGEGGVGAGMGSGMEASDAVSMGKSMTTPKKSTSGASEATPGAASGMSGM